MKVGELIEKLRQYDSETEVCLASDNFELGGALVKVAGVCPLRVREVEQRFIDAFERTEYVKKVFEPATDGDAARVLKIFGG